jgi:hypothetical protein
VKRDAVQLLDLMQAPAEPSPAVEQTWSKGAHK